MEQPLPSPPLSLPIENVAEIPAASEGNESVARLATGFVQMYEPHIQTVTASINELMNKQLKIESDLIQENRNISVATLQPTQDMMNNLKVYKEKLINIRKKMLTIHQKTRNLKKRAQFLQEFKSKELDDKVQKRLHEESLIGSSSTSSLRS